MKDETRNGFRLGDWQVYPLRNLLVGPPGEVHIEPKVMQVLDCLASNAGQVVERETLLNDLWDGRAFSDEPLTRCVAALRRALGDSPKVPEYVQTIPKSGYRLVCPVESIAPTTDDADVDSDKTSIASQTSMPTGWRRIALAALFGVTLIAAPYVAYRSILFDMVDSPQLTAEGTTLSEPPVSSIVVLPFLAMSSGEDDEYFSDGLSEELLNTLAQIDGLKVIGRSSSFYYKGKNEDLRTIGSTLGVAHVLEGSVRRSGDSLRITAQLTQTSDGFNLWSHTYDRKADDIFAIQTDIATQVADALMVTLLGESIAALSNYGTTNAEARSLYLIARARNRQNSYLMATSASPPLQYGHARSTRELLEQVVRLDPRYADAWAALARAYILETRVLPDDSGESITIDEGTELASDAVDRARNLAPDLTATKLAHADLLFRLYRTSDVTGWERVALAYDEVIAVASDDPEVLAAAAYFYHSTLRLEKAANLYDRVLLVDPLSDHRMSRAEVLLAGKLAEARQEFIKTGELYPESNWMYGMADLEYQLGHLHHALVWSEDFALEYYYRPFIWASLGDSEKALREMTDRAGTGMQKIATDMGVFFFERDYQGFRDWTQSADVRSAIIASGRSMCGQEYRAAFYLRDWETAASARDTCEKAVSTEILERGLGTAAGRSRASQLDAERQIRLTLSIASRAYVYQQAGRPDEAAPLWNWASELLESAEPLFVIQQRNKMHFRALIQAGRGQREAALDTFEALYDAGWRGLLMGVTGMSSAVGGDYGWFEDNPMLDSIHDEPRFKAVVASVKADNAKMLAEYKAGISRDDIIDEDLGDMAVFEIPIN